MEKDINHPVGREQELFPIIRRFCTEQTCYQGLKPDDQVSRYYKNTTQLLAEDLLKETPDPDDTYTIATNYMLIMANTAEAQKQKKKMISFVKEAYDAENAKTMVARTFSIPTDHEQETASSNKNVQELLTCFITFGIVIVLVLSIISLVLGVSSFSDRMELNSYVEREKAEKKNIFQEFGDWVAHDVFHAPRKETEYKQQLTNSVNTNQQKALILLGVNVVLIFLIVSASRAKKSLARKFEGDVWEDYLKLCSLFDEAEARVLGGIG